MGGEILETDLLIVGAGSASLAAAYRVKELAREKGREIDVVILEKCREVGDAILSGAVMDPRGIEELMPAWVARGAPTYGKAASDTAYFLTESKGFRLPLTPPPLRQHGCHILSLSQFTRWLGKVVEEMGANLFTGFAGRELIYEGDSVVGVRTGDKGLNKKGERKSNFEPGVEIRAKLTILGEGVRGNLTRDHIKRLGLDRGRNPPSFGTGVKEVWEIPSGRFPKGTVYHTMGFPLIKGGGMGGGWLYGMEENLLSLGYVVWLAYQDPLMDPHERFQLFKTHPMIRKILEGGRMVQYGAKAVSVGGYFSIPQIYSDGCLFVGESANLVDGMKLKGIHLALGSGKLAGEVAFEAFQKSDFSSQVLRRYEERFEGSWMKEELWRSRNFHQSFDGGFLKGMIRTGFQTILGGRDLRGGRLPAACDVRHVQKVQGYYGNSKKGPGLKYDNRFLFDKLTDVYHSGTIHEEDQPSHLIVPDMRLCVERCAKEYGNPCTRFCPAEVYEMEGEGKERHLKLNPSNCVHCKTCDIMDPYDNIRWVPPEGGGGPRYTIL